MRYRIIVRSAVSTSAPREVSPRQISDRQKNIFVGFVHAIKMVLICWMICLTFSGRLEYSSLMALVAFMVRSGSLVVFSAMTAALTAAGSDSVVVAFMLCVVSGGVIASHCGCAYLTGGHARDFFDLGSISVMFGF